MNELPIWTPKPGDIFEFQDRYRFLSNFWHCHGMLAPTLEHHFQATKTVDESERALVMACTSPGQAKRMGKKVTLRSGWDGMKDQVMFDLLTAKFRPESPFCKLLLATGTATLVEGNSWGDQYWGATKNYSGKGWTGHNKLGVMLMEIRDGLFR